MIIDTSAAVSILLNESDAADFFNIINKTEICRMSAANVLEAYMVAVSRGGARGEEQLDGFLAYSNIEIVPADLPQLYAAIDAWRRFGKGNHPAVLNFGDCFAYALAYTAGESLLFKGDDFSRTDIQPAL